MVLIGIAIFAGASALCGATPDGSIAEPWLIFWRVVQGAGAAIMFPAALAIVVAAYPQEERGKAMAAFFGIAGGLTAIGPLAGGFLIEISWRTIFWINVPVAIAAVLLTLKAPTPTTPAARRSSTTGAPSSPRSGSGSSCSASSRRATGAGTAPRPRLRSSSAWS